MEDEETITRGQGGNEDLRAISVVVSHGFDVVRKLTFFGQCSLILGLGGCRNTPAKPAFPRHSFTDNKV